MDYRSKPGKHGTLYLWTVSYHDVPGPDGTYIGQWRTWAYNIDDAWERWYDSLACGEEGFAAVGEFTRVREVLP